MLYLFQIQLANKVCTTFSSIRMLHYGNAYTVRVQLAGSTMQLSASSLILHYYIYLFDFCKNGSMLFWHRTADRRQATTTTTTAFFPRVVSVALSTG